MVQSQSSNVNEAKAVTQHNIPLPKRSFSIEFWVGLFTMCGVAAMGYLSIRLGELQLFTSNKYSIYAEFDNISGLKTGASVEIGGVPIGEVSAITLKDPMARVELRLDPAIQIGDEDQLMIRTKGIIGDRYIKISRGASTNYIPVGGTTMETESVVDLEDLIGKFVHQMGNDKDEEKKDKKGKVTIEEVK